jgi:Arylsulfotransferase (ASST)
VTNQGANSTSSAKFTRRKFLKTLGAGTGWLALTNDLGCEPAGRTPKTAPPTTTSAVHSEPVRVVGSPSTQPQDAWTFRSRPDLSPPVVEVIRQAHDTAPGYIFVAPKEGTGQNGPMIIDNRGQVVWFLPLQSEDEYAMDFKVQYYQGEPVLTWEVGKVVGYSLGEYVILDGSYQEITRLSAANGYRADHHEFLITSDYTAMFTIYSPVSMDLFSVGGPKNGVVVDGIVQAVDMETGQMFFEWHSLDHVGLDESYYEPPNDQGQTFDYFHINSIDIDHDSNLLVSARNTSTVYKIDPMSGEVIWRLGGKKSDFEMGEGTRFAYQHDARRLSDGTITIFDNGGWNGGEHSRGLVLELDEDGMTVSLVREYLHPYEQHADTQGNMQTLPKGNVFIGWGSEPLFSEISSNGELLFNARFPPKVESYRAFRFPWKGQPSDDPAMVAERGSDDKATLYASWNGATEVATWEVLAGPGPERLKPVGSVPRYDFETAITVGTAERYVGVQAKDSSGRVLGTSRSTGPI